MKEEIEITVEDQSCWREIRIQFIYEVTSQSFKGKQERMAMVFSFF